MGEPVGADALEVGVVEHPATTSTATRPAPIRLRDGRLDVLGSIRPVSDRAVIPGFLVLERYEVEMGVG